MCVYVCMCVCVCVCVCVYVMWMYACVYMCTCVFVCIHTYFLNCVCIRICMHVYKHTHGRGQHNLGIHIFMDAHSTDGWIEIHVLHQMYMEIIAQMIFWGKTISDCTDGYFPYAWRPVRVCARKSVLKRCNRYMS